MSQNSKTIARLSKTCQDQHLKMSQQSHILFYEVLFEKEHSKPPLPPKANICARNCLSPQELTSL